MVDQSRKGRLGRLDYTGCITDKDFERRNQEYWAPPELTLMKHSKYEVPITPELSSSGDQLEQEGYHSLHLHRRRSDSYLSPMTPESISPPVLFQGPQSGPPSRNTMSPFMKTSEALLRSKGRLQGNEKEISLEERMHLLLVVDEDKKESPQLNLSQYMVEKRTRLAKEKKLREREAAARAAKELRLTRRYPLKPLVQDLDKIWEEKVLRAEHTNSHAQVITTSLGGTELHLKDFRSLLGKSAWLNDEIVNTYLEWIVDAANKTATADSQARGEKVGTVPKFIAHNSFFYENLESKGPSTTERLMKRKKAPGKSLMEVDSVFVPICRSSHWTVGIVRPVAMTIEYFDSFGGGSQKFVDHMRKWLKFQLEDTYVEEEWQVSSTKCAPQSNGYDCGVFVCTNSLCVARGLDTLCYSQNDLTQQRRNIAAVLINRGFTGDFLWEKEG
jgi:sentrin-specific protease 1